MKEEPKFERHEFSACFDIVAILSLAVLPDMLRSFLATNSTGAVSSSLNSLLLMLIVRSLQVSLPILLILNLRRVRWAEYGFAKLRLIRDPLIAFGLAILGYATYYLLAYGLLFSGVDFSGDPDALQNMTQDAQLTFHTVVLVILASCANGFAEEIAIRSYLIVRIGEWCGSLVVAAIFTTLLFAAYHSYQGRFGVVSALAVGTVFAAYFVTTKRFWPIAIAHALMDLIALATVLTSDAG